MHASEGDKCLEGETRSLQVSEVEMVHWFFGGNNRWQAILEGTGDNHRIFVHCPIVFVPIQLRQFMSE
jgi:hypothetical protein